MLYDNTDDTGPIMPDGVSTFRNPESRLNKLMNQPMGLILEDDPRKLIDKAAKGIELTDFEARYLAEAMMEDPELAQEYDINVMLAGKYNEPNTDEDL